MTARSGAGRGAREPQPDPVASLQGVARSIREVQLLLLLLTALYYVVAREAIVSSRAWFLTLLVFAVAVLVAGAVPALRNPPRRRLAVETTAMTLFIAALIAQAGASASTLNHLFLLPVVTAALLLGRPATGMLVALILVCRVLLGLAGHGASWLSAPTLITLFADLSPTLLVAFLTSALASDLDRAKQTIRSLAERDDLTGLYNLRSMSTLAAGDFQAVSAEGAPCALLMIDVDQLSEINDRFGHEAGDHALQSIAAALRRATRAGDLCARYGGDEFVVFLPRCGHAAAESVASRIRHDVYSATQDFDYTIRRLAVSIGIAASPDDGLELRALFRKANREMRLDRQARRSREAAASPLSRGFAPR